MHSEQVRLRHPRAGMPATLRLREPAGRDELALDGTDTRSAATLLARLVIGEVDVFRLAACDRDALLAAFHRQCWSDRIDATLSCVACTKRFDLGFELSALQRYLASNDPDWAVTGDGRITHTDGRTLLTPCAADELAAAEHGAQAGVSPLAAACGAMGDAIPAAALALEVLAPIVDVELAARCVECGHEQFAHFDLQGFVLQRLLYERAAMLAEVHLLAANYGWSLREILALPRRTRRAFAEMIAQASPRVVRRRER